MQGKCAREMGKGWERTLVYVVKDVGKDVGEKKKTRKQGGRLWGFIYSQKLAVIKPTSAPVGLPF